MFFVVFFSSSREEEETREYQQSLIFSKWVLKPEMMKGNYIVFSQLIESSVVQKRN